MAEATDYLNHPYSSESTLACMTNPPSSPALLDLPNELLILIADIIAFGYKSPKHINSLLLTNRRFSLICTPLLTQRAFSFRLRKGGTVLHFAANLGYPNVVERLLSSGMDVDIDGLQPGDTPLRWAALYGHVNVMQQLISSGASVRARKPNILPPIVAAAMNGHTAAIDLLVANGAYFSAPEEGKDWSEGNAWGEWPDGNRALHRAARNNHLDVVQKLLGYGANASSKDENGATALLQAARCRRRDWNGLRIYDVVDYDNFVESPDVVRFLISTGVSISEVDHNGNTALHLAVGNHRMTDLLCHPSIINVRNSDGLTALHLACRPDTYYCIRYLLDSGADIEAKNKEGQTPLIFTLADVYEPEDDYENDTRLELLGMLLKEGANVNAVGNDAFSALDHAVRRGASGAVKILLEHGANPNGGEGDSVTTSDSWLVRTAKKRGHDHIVKLLLEHGANGDPLGGEKEET